MTSEPLKKLTDRAEQYSHRNMSQQKKKFIDLLNAIQRFKLHESLHIIKHTLSIPIGTLHQSSKRN